MFICYNEQFHLYVYFIYPNELEIKFTTDFNSATRYISYMQEKMKYCYIGDEILLHRYDN
jgi:hypothetical protein